MWFKKKKPTQEVFIPFTPPQLLLSLEPDMETDEEVVRVVAQWEVDDEFDISKYINMAFILGNDRPEVMHYICVAIRRFGAENEDYERAEHIAKTIEDIFSQIVQEKNIEQPLIRASDVHKHHFFQGDSNG